MNTEWTAEHVLAETLAKTIDHTQLKAEAASEDIVKLCAEAREYGFYSVCVNPFWVPFAVQELEGSGVEVCTVAGFPLGAALSGPRGRSGAGSAGKNRYQCRSQGHYRNLLSYGYGKGSGLHLRETGRSGFRENLHRIRRPRQLPLRQTDTVGGCRV